MSDAETVTVQSWSKMQQSEESQSRTEEKDLWKLELIIRTTKLLLHNTTRRLKEE